MSNDELKEAIRLMDKGVGISEGVGIFYFCHDTMEPEEAALIKKALKQSGVDLCLGS